MVALPSWLTAPLAVGLSLAPDGAVAAKSGSPFFRKSASPTYSSSGKCPERCSVAGPNPGNWSVYPDFQQIKRCKETMFYDFSLDDRVDEAGVTHRIHACSSFGPDFAKLPSNDTSVTIAAASVQVKFEMGWWEEGFGLAAGSLRSLTKQIRKYADHGHGATDRPFIMFGQSGQAAIGLYIGQGLLNQGLSESALKVFQDNLANVNVSTPSLAMQLCGADYDSSHTFGVMVTSNGTFGPIQDAVKSWGNGTCLEFAGSTNLTGRASFTTPLSPPTHANGTAHANSTTLDSALVARAECRTVQVEPDDTCEKLAAKCGIPPAAFTKVNPDKNFCGNLKPKQHACCSMGNMPNFSPKPNADGTCHSYQVVTDDNCDNLAAEYSLTKQDLEDFNKNTWGWNGCKLLFIDTVMCLSKGTAPFPAPIANALCGPQKPGSTPPTDGSDIADMNPCPLNACCNIWGQCGITKDFCVDTNTGAPGTAKPGTYGCISNCGTDVVKGDGSGAISIGYFEGYGMGRDCLFQDASQVDTSKYTHVHFGFGTLTTDYQVEVGDVLSTYQFSQFKELRGAKRVLSFGGWAFSTEPATYSIFRNGVTPGNRLQMATNIANFIKKHDLDGVDIDWEYPGAPDIPGIPAASKDDGKNYLAFLVVLKNLLPGKSISIAAPSSYWYLKQYPIKDIARVVDYIVYMTYDLHGQWDTDNANSQEGCANGNCLRSQVNLTETKQSLAMITKAGVPGNKIIVGVTSYGRSYSMAEAGCWGPDCVYTGSREKSDATPGKCTATAGYIADAEIAEVMSGKGSKRGGSRVTKSFVDSSSNSDILVYDDLQWVSYMSASTKKTRTSLYKAWGMGGTSDWATDLQEYHDVPIPSKDWATFKQKAKSGNNPKSDDSRNHTWTDLDCTNEMILHPYDHYPSERWEELHADAAWEDLVRIWKDTDRHYGRTFMQSVEQTLKEGANLDCGSISASNCNEARECTKGLDGPYSGPAAQLIYNSLVTIHQMYSSYYTALYDVAGSEISNALDDLENKFAPIPAEEDNTWLLVLIDLITVGTLSVAGPFFNSFLKKLPYFIAQAEKNSGALDNLKDTTMNMIGQSTTLAKDLLTTPGSNWTAESQDSFTNYMGQTITGWGNVTSLGLERIFNGDDASLDILWDVISDGKLVKGWDGTDDTNIKKRADDEANADNELRQNIAKSFFGYAIPALWQVSKSYAFVIDSGYSCDDDRPLGDYLDDDTMDATGACVDGRRYYLAYPDGDANKCECHYYDNGHCERVCRDQKFSSPPGLDSLDGSIFGRITKEDLITGSVRTYMQNGKANGGGFADPTDGGTIDNLLKVDVTTPGFMRLPVCSPERAFQSWDTTSKGSSPNYPCDIPPGRDTCGDSTFENQSSGASPKVEDCLQIIQNIQGDGSTDWTTQVVGHNQREIAKSGTCHFGVEATKTNGNVNFVVGGQDVIDIINEAIKQFGGDGRVGAKGDMDCNGNSHQQAVKWGIY
ncbi:hypothetical protein PG984_007818 [Apiospora sp. TS-2023a]